MALFYYKGNPCINPNRTEPVRVNKSASLKSILCCYTFPCGLYSIPMVLSRQYVSPTRLSK
jgi:hypothetical protein